MTDKNHTGVDETSDRAASRLLPHIERLFPDERHDATARDARSMATRVLDHVGLDPGAYLAPDGTRLDACHTDYLVGMALCVLGEENHGYPGGVIERATRLDESDDAGDGRAAALAARDRTSRARSMLTDAIAGKPTNVTRTDATQRRGAGMKKRREYAHPLDKKLLIAIGALAPELRADAASWACPYKRGMCLIDLVKANPDHVTRTGTKVRNRSDDFVIAYALKAAEIHAGMSRLDEAPAKVESTASRAAMVERNQTAWLPPTPAEDDAPTPMPADDEIAQMIATGSRDELAALIGKLTAERADAAPSPRDQYIARQQGAYKKPVT